MKNKLMMLLAIAGLALIPTGAFAASVNLGWTAVTTNADGTAITSRWVRIGPIVKPAWRLAISTDTRAILSGLPAAKGRMRHRAALSAVPRCVRHGSPRCRAR